MTEAEKKRMLAIVRSCQALYGENVALKTVLFHHGVPSEVYENEVSRLLKDRVIADRIYSRFEPLYAEIAKVADESKALERLLKALPKPKTDVN